MAATYDVIIIGGGVTGLGTAYQLAKRGVKRVLVLDKGFIGQGASARNAGGIRQQWGSPENIQLSKFSVKQWETLSAELNFNVLFRQAGYFFMLCDDDTISVFERNIAFQNEQGVPSRFYSVEEARRIVPVLDYSGVQQVAYCAQDGVVFHFPVVWAYAQAAQRLGVEVHVYEEVQDIVVEAGQVSGVTTSKGSYKAPVVLNAAGGWSSQVAALAGESLPVQPERHELLVTEPLKPMMNPMVIDTRTGIHFYQTSRGEVVIGAHWSVELDEPGSTSAYRFLEQASLVLNVVPQLADVRVMRQWGGMYDVTPDHKPLLGESKKAKGFYYACGFSGHGFMVSPAVTQTMACLITDQEPPVDVYRLRASRFEEDDFAPDPAVL